MEVTARSILETPISAIEQIFKKGVKYLVQYEDGVVLPEHQQAILLNRYCWELFQFNPSTRIVSKCSSIDIIGKGYYNSNVPVKLLENTFKHICKENNIHRYSDKEKFLKTCYRIINDIFNNIVHRKGEHVATIDATDFIQVINDPVIVKAQESLLPTPESVENTYRAIRGYMSNTNERNRFVEAYRAKAINENQANQCIGPRGFVTGLDRTVFRKPITSGFIRGMSTLYEILTESLTAAKSLNATDTHIRTSEYASRRIQLLTMSVTSIDVNDCGSTEYLNIFVTEKYLPNLVGKWYKVFDTDELKEIQGNETDLLNRVIKVRSAFGCKSPNPHQICSKCLGSLSENFKENSNVGYTMAAFLMEKLTQAILSTKHLTHSVKKSAIKLEGAAEKFFYSSDSNDIYFNPDLKLNKVSIILPANKLNKLADVLNLDHTNVALNKVGELEVVGILYEKNGTLVQETINISYKDRLSTITRDLLKHLKATDIEVDSRGNYIVPMSDFDISRPVFSNQMKETNIVSFVNRIASIIECTKPSKLNLEEHFFMFMDTVLDQFPCNISVLETIVYATTTYNHVGGNYRLGRNSPHAKQENNTVLFRNRSASQLLVYEGQQTELLKHSVTAFSNNLRMDHPLDVLFAPAEVVRQNIGK